MLSDNGHSAGGRGGGVEATAVRAVGCVCAIRTSITLLVVGASIQAPTLVGCRVTEPKYQSVKSITNLLIKSSLLCLKIEQSSCSQPGCSTVLELVL